jgi:TPR repeat protein
MAPAPASRLVRTAILALTLSGCAEAPPGEAIRREALFQGGLAAFTAARYGEAAGQWLGAAELGDADAARNLGHLYRQGLGVEQDVSIAVAWYQVAADSGNPAAEYNLGMTYLNGGPRFPRDRLAALHWLNRAAADGVAPARAELDRLAAEAPAAK